MNNANEERSITEQTVTKTSNPLARFKGRFTIKPYKKTWIDSMTKAGDNTGLFDGAITMLPPEIDPFTNIVRTGLSDEEARALETEMGLKVMDLSPYSKFWSNFKMYATVKKDGAILDLDRSAIDKIRYAYLIIQKKVSLSTVDALENGFVEYVILNADKESEIGSKKIKIKLDAMKVLSEMTLTEQSDFLKVYEEGKYKLGKNATPDAILTKAGEIVDQYPAKFLELVKAPNYKAALFLQECMSIGAIRKSGGAYYIAGGEVLGKSYEDALNNLQKPEFQEVKISLKAKIEASR